MITIFKVESLNQDIGNAKKYNIRPLSNIENKKVNLDGWDITVSFPIEEKKHIKQGYLLQSETKEDGLQLFRIHNYEYDKTTVTITAYHVMYDMKDLLVEEFSGKNITATHAMISINNNTDTLSPFTITGNVESLLDLEIYAQSMLDITKHILSTTRAYITADNWNLHITDKIGMDTGESVAYGKNLYNFSYREDFDEVTTRLYPFFKIGESKFTLPEKYVDSDYKYNKEYTKAIQFEPTVPTHLEPEVYEDGTKEENPPMNVEDLRQDLRFQAARHLNISQFPKISYKISSTLNVPFRIGDIVHFKHPALTKAMPLTGNDFEGLSIPIEVYSYEYDVVSKTLNALTYGDLETKPYDKIKNFATEIVLDKTQTLSDFMATSKEHQAHNDRVRENIQIDLIKKQQLLDEQSQVIENLNKNGHLVIYENELYAVDVLPLEEATNVLNLGQGGLTFSTSGINGPWNMAIGIDGKINANQILVGELDGSIIKTNTITAEALTVEAKQSIIIGISGRVDGLEQQIQDIELNKVWFGYSANSNGNPMYSSPRSDSKYIGTYSGTSRSSDYNDYEWALYKGTEGESSYIHVRYSDNENGSGMSAIPSPTRPYMGISTTNSPTASNVPSDYVWSKYVGESGTNGISIISVEEFYKLGTSGTTPPSGTYSKTPSTPTNESKYLWNYEVFEYSNGTSQETVKRVISVYGDKGQAGEDGSSIWTTTIAPTTPNYTFTISNLSGPTNQTPKVGDTILYTYYRYTITSVASTTVIAPTRVSIRGATGAAGTDGASIDTITNYYLASASSSGVTTSTSGWTTTPQATSTSERYLWNYELITYTQGRQSTTTTPTIIGTHGATGPQGQQGIQGPAGANGQSQYVFIRYSANSNGSDMTTTPNTNTKYIGVVNTTTNTVPAYTAFTWSKYVGDQGPQGIPGQNGENGVTTYTWVKYADTPTTGMSNSAANKKYIGLAFNKTTSTPSTNYVDYQWSLLPQNIDISGVNLIRESNNEIVFSEREDIETTSDMNGKPKPSGAPNLEDMIYAYAYRLTTYLELNEKYVLTLGQYDETDWYAVWLNEDYFLGYVVNGELRFVDARATRPVSNGNEDESVDTIIIKSLNGSTMSRPMLVRGDMKADWSPAPEDTMNEILRVETAYLADLEIERGRINLEVETREEQWGTLYDATQTNAGSIELLDTKLTTTISDTNTMIEDTETMLKQYVDTEMLQTLQGWEFNFNEILDSIQNVDGELTAEKEERTKYIRFIDDIDEGPTIEIGDTESAFKVKITNTKMAFLQNGKEIAYISNNKLQVTDGYFENSLEIGNFAFVPRENGSLTFGKK